MRMSLTLSLFMMGCAFNGASSGDEPGAGMSPEMTSTEEVVASQGDALTTSWISGPYTWRKDESAKAMQPVSTHICVMSRIQGRFGGGGESVSVAEDGDFWYLGGTAQQAGVAVEAYCYNRSFISSLSGGATSSEFEAFASGNPRWCLGQVQTDTWSGNAATMISGLAGKMDGGGEAVSIDQSASAFAASQLNAETCGSAGTWGYAHSFRFGPAASGRLVTFVGPTGALGKVNQIAEKTVTGNNGYAVLAPSGQSLCYFTRISGGFFGGGESAEIVRERIGTTDYWVLRTHQGTSSANLKISARCISRNQN